MSQISPPTANQSQSNKSKLPYFLMAVFIALAIALFLVFRPVPSDEQLIRDDGEPKRYDPVVYQTDTWSRLPKKQLDFEGIKRHLGTTATSEQSLDFYGNHATKYRFTTKSEPPFYVIESEAVLEVLWYYAAPKDNDAQKTASIDYAQKVYAMMGTYAGEEGERLVAGMLNQPNRLYATKVAGVLSANCTNYQCRIIFNR
ncbi:hypothetical protein LU276_09235 [Moraxella haemolytica]|uniref:hypothetical protein n=1 Tax=Moraxella haemolytica TaxID=2904119 RepID=UPI002543BB27|nr:hypothetical protein [Moraxella sp. ZY171148]WII95167.1 hypothetical protein LU276_09235 [Moraxella sp. ZY171148]